MRLPDITGLICLSCVLMFFYVNSQTSNCTTGWFGARCHYKCRCTNDSCDGKGMCLGTAACQGGWFGPACQYADVAYYTRNRLAVTDGNDSTCIEVQGIESLALTLNYSIIFTWLRVRVADKVTDALKSLSLTLALKTTAVICADLKTHVVNKWTLDMNCKLTEPINTVNVTGRAMTSVCSVYVSGGRNVALKQRAVHERQYITTTQSVYTTPVPDYYNTTTSSSPVSFPADLAVDGNTVEDLLGGRTCSQSLDAQTWTLSFLDIRRVHRYVIYNRRDESAKRLIGFTLESFNSRNVSVFTYKDSSTQAAYNYTLTHPPMSVMTVQVRTNNTDRIIQLCEVEVYGDSVCDFDKYGLECEHSCMCLGNESCFVSTGGCPSGCPNGFQGDGCLSNCSVGKFGHDCQSECSRNCEPSGDLSISVCNFITGACVQGCQPGFSGELCQDECASNKYGHDCTEVCSLECAPSISGSVCNSSDGTCSVGCRSGFRGQFCTEQCPVGTFGQDCKATCSTKCAPHNDTSKSPCDHVNGTCIYECTSGFSGPLCTNVSKKASDFTIEYIVGLCLLAALIFFIIFCLCWRKRRRPVPEAKPRALPSPKPAERPFQAGPVSDIESQV